MTGPAALPARIGADLKLWACTQCGKCTADCPFSLAPNLVVRLAQLGQIAAARAVETTWECASCFTCEVACPNGVSPYRLMKRLRGLDGRRPTGRPGEDDGFLEARRDGAGPPGRGPVEDIRHRLRARLFASMPGLLRTASRLGRASTVLLASRPARLLGDWLLGVDRRRPLPPVAREPFPAWFRRHGAPSESPLGTVLLFHDTFMDFSYPQVGIAATRLLEAAGFRVAVPDTVCCGRPAISKGIERIASAAARRNVARLYDGARRGIPIVGCEPSCLLTLRDDYPDLVPPEERERARVVARQAFLLDEFLCALREDGTLDRLFREATGRGPALFHGHCHQKARANPEASMELLRRAGYEAEMANAACCGMAGAYGFEREHYDRSKEAGERGLFPEIRFRPEATVVVVGASCRQQIEHFLGRSPLHLAEALERALTGAV